MSPRYYGTSNRSKEEIHQRGDFSIPSKVQRDENLYFSNND